MDLLFVDDDPRIVRAIVPALEVTGLRVTVASSGRAAIDELERQTWGALVVDLGLPDMDGKVVIRRSKARSAAPIIVISAQHSQAEVNAAHLAGASYFLHKPFRTPALVECIKVFLTAK
jgi:two-component system KDP operon response regulator KdpE